MIMPAPTKTSRNAKRSGDEQPPTVTVRFKDNTDGSKDVQVSVTGNVPEARARRIARQVTLAYAADDEDIRLLDRSQGKRPPPAGFRRVYAGDPAGVSAHAAGRNDRSRRRAGEADRDEASPPRARMRSESDFNRLVKNKAKLRASAAGAEPARAGVMSEAAGMVNRKPLFAKRAAAGGKRGRRRSNSVRFNRNK